MFLWNVKLKPDDVRMAQALRKEGIVISDIVRDAIRTTYGKRIDQRTSRQRPSDRMAEIYATHPDPTDLPPRDYDVHDARAARQAIVTKVRRSAG